MHKFSEFVNRFSITGNIQGATNFLSETKRVEWKPLEIESIDFYYVGGLKQNLPNRCFSKH